MNFRNDLEVNSVSSENSSRLEPKIIHIDENMIKDHLGKIVKGTVESTLLEKFLEKLDNIWSELSDLKAEVKANKSHDSPCPFLCDHIASQSQKIKDIHNRIEEHKYKDHSSRSSLEIGEFMQPYYAHYLLWQVYLSVY